MKSCRCAVSGLVAGVALWVAVPGAVRACQVPVFRYALERWLSDPYELVVVTGPEGLSPAREQVLRALRAATTDQTSLVNLTLRVVAETAPPAGTSPPPETPRFELYYPAKLRPFLTADPIWRGAVTAENAARVLRSPARTELVKRLLAGDSAVWVLLETSDPGKNAAAAAALKGMIAEAAARLKIPEGVIGLHEIDAGRRPAPEEAENVLQARIPLKIAFSLLRVSRDDPEEAVLRGMLLHLEDDRGDYADQPLAFPVFGRGRALEPLIGAGLTRDNVLRASGYLCGPCSCVVKEQNPGVDLLIAANWDAALAGSEVVPDKVLPPLAGFPGPAATENAPSSDEASPGEALPLPPDAPPGAAPPAEGGLSPWEALGLVLLAVLAVIGIASWKMKRNTT
jgi:hypothetical protein